MGSHSQLWINQMTPDDKPFFVELGKRIALLRKEQNLTQQELAEKLGIAQQTLAHYEVARLRVPASMLPTLGNIFGIPVDELLGQPPTVARSGKRGPPSQLQLSLERISALPKAKQKFVLEMLETVLAQTNS